MRITKLVIESKREANALKKTSIALVLLLAIMLVMGMACSNGGCEGEPYSLDDYYIDIDDPSYLYVTLSWECEECGYNVINVYDEVNQKVGSARDSQFDEYIVSPNGETCSITKSIRYYPYYDIGEAFSAGSRYELIIGVQWFGRKDAGEDVSMWSESFNHIIYPPARTVW